MFDKVFIASPSLKTAKNGPFSCLPEDQIEQELTVDFLVKGSVKWKDPNCMSSLPAETAVCDPMQGIAASRIQCTLSMAWQTTGGKRYEALSGLREDIGGMLTGSFPVMRHCLSWR